MPFTTLPPEIIYRFTDFLDDCHVTALIRTSKWLASLLTPQLYDRAFTRYDQRLNEYGEKVENGKENMDKKEAQPKLRKFTEEMWNAASSWKSEWIVEYLFRKIDEPFLCPSTEVCSAYDRELYLLAIMAEVKNHEMLAMLLANDAVRSSQLEIIGVRDHTPLTLATEAADLVGMQMLLDAGANPLRTQMLLYSACSSFCAPTEVREATVRKAIEVVKAAGGSVSVLRGDTPLHLAIGNGLLEAVKPLVEAGADLWIQNTEGRVPLESAVHMLISEDEDGLPDYNSNGAKIPHLLLEYILQNDAGAPPGWKESALHAALNGRESVNVSFIQRILETGVDIFARDQRGKTALELTHEMPGDINYRREAWGDGCPEVHDVAAALLMADPYIWPPGHINRQLWEAARGGVVEEYHLVLFNLLISTGKTALELDAGGGHRDFTTLHYLCDAQRSYRGSTKPGENNLRMIKVMLEHGASISAQSEWGETPLFMAVRRQKINIVRLLLQERPNDPALNLGFRMDRLPLLTAAGLSDLEMIEALLDAGADPALTGEEGKTALHHLMDCWTPDARVCRRLIDAGCSVAVLDNFGQTALHRAVNRGFIPGIEMLVEAGCPADLQGKGSCSVLRMACTKHGPDMLEVLVQLSGPGIVTDDDTPPGDLVCDVLSSNHPGAKPNARTLYRYGAAIHGDCERCDNFREELDVE